MTGDPWGDPIPAVKSPKVHFGVYRVLAQFGWIIIDLDVEYPDAIRRNLVAQLVGRTQKQFVGLIP